MKKVGKLLAGLLVGTCALLVLIPLYMLLTGSFMGRNEITEYIGPAMELTEGGSSWSILPKYPTARPYVELLLDTPHFFVMFWNSVKQVTAILAGQLLISVPAAWAFARYRFKGRKLLFKLYILLMILPFQVTMVSNYLVLDFFHLTDTHLAVILPAVFSTFPVFIITKFFSSIPNSVIEAARLDGAGELRVFFHIGIPLGKTGIISSMVLMFLEYWNALEQPMIFLSNPSKFPLSLYLPRIGPENIGIALASSVVMLLPALLIFLYGQSYLQKGIEASGLKE